MCHRLKNQSGSRIIAIPLITTIDVVEEKWNADEEGREERKKGQGFSNGNRKDTFEDCLDSTPIRA